MIDIKNVYEDAMVAASAPSGDVQSAPAGNSDVSIVKPSGTTDTDVLGNCDHNKECGYMKDGCFHFPNGVAKLSKREILAGKKKKKHKNPYTSKMNVISDAELSRQMILDIHNVHEDVIIAFLKQNWNFSKLPIQRVVSIAYYPPNKSIFIKVECKDSGHLRMFFVQADFVNKKFKQSVNAQIYNTTEMKKEYKKILNMANNNPDNTGSDNFSLWVIWGEN